MKKKGKSSFDNMPNTDTVFVAVFLLYALSYYAYAFSKTRKKRKRKANGTFKSFGSVFYFLNESFFY